MFLDGVPTSASVANVALRTGLVDHWFDGWGNRYNTRWAGGATRGGLCLGPVCISGHIDDGGTWGNIFNGIVNGDWSGFYGQIPGVDTPIFDANKPDPGDPEKLTRCIQKANAKFLAGGPPKKDSKWWYPSKVYNFTVTKIFSRVTPAFAGISMAGSAIETGYEAGRFYEWYANEDFQYQRDQGICQALYGPQ